MSRLAVKKLQPGEALVEVGSRAMRNPDGSFQPATPLYIIVPADTVSAKSGLTKEEENLLENVGSVIADDLRQYMEAEKARRKALQGEDTYEGA